MKAIDIHSHLFDKPFADDQEVVIARMKEAGVATITVGTDLKESRESLEIAKKLGMWATVGLHPADNREEVFDYAEYLNLAKEREVVAIGECGLDYFHLDPTGTGDWQKERFEKQIALAQEVGKPLMLHIRNGKDKSHDAYLDVLSMLPADVRGNVHFFAGDYETAKKFFDRGFSISFTGVITFARDYDEVIKNAPLDMIMAETDAPYVAPAPYRGKRNEPVYVLEVIKKMAEIRGISFEAMIEATTRNTERVFGISIA